MIKYTDVKEKTMCNRKPFFLFGEWGYCCTVTRYLSLHYLHLGGKVFHDTVLVQWQSKETVLRAFPDGCPAIEFYAKAKKPWKEAVEKAGGKVLADNIFDVVRVLAQGKELKRLFAAGHDRFLYIPDIAYVKNDGDFRFHFEGCDMLVEYNGGTRSKPQYMKEKIFSGLAIDRNKSYPRIVEPGYITFTAKYYPGKTDTYTAAFRLFRPDFKYGFFSPGSIKGVV